MKLLVLLLVLLFGVWLWQRGRRVPGSRHDAARPALPMVRCRHCGLHLPGSDAVAGREGSYCSAAHRRESEGA